MNLYLYTTGATYKIFDRVTELNQWVKVGAADVKYVQEYTSPMYPVQLSTTKLKYTYGFNTSSNNRFFECSTFFKAPVAENGYFELSSGRQRYTIKCTKEVTGTNSIYGKYVTGKNVKDIPLSRVWYK